MNELEHMREDFQKHAAEDREFAERTMEFMAESKEARVEVHRKLDEINTKLGPILDFYKAVLLSRGFLVGLASVIVAITGIGAAVVWIINAAVKK